MTELKTQIRKEQPGDASTIHEVTTAAFLDAPHADHTEQFIVRALRDAGVLSVSLVAENDGDIVGHVAVSPVTVSDGVVHWYGLGPISVIPECQGQGIGSQLMRVALDELKAMGAGGCVLLGDPGYYHRFGFRAVEGLVLPGLPPEYFMAVSFSGDYPRGDVSYHQAFSATE